MLPTRSFAYVTYADVNGANNAIKTLNGVEFEGRKARVEASRPPSA